MTSDLATQMAFPLAEEAPAQGPVLGSHDQTSLVNPLIRIATTAGESQSSLTGQGTDYSTTNLHRQEHYQSTSVVDQIGSQSSAFGRTF